MRYLMQEHIFIMQIFKDKIIIFSTLRIAILNKEETITRNTQEAKEA
ncbi:unnamed protein product [Paramecium sonneborni]|uniref:Uncharacterized protein n=1 Tax=Paramecium sonneborni TaxID=65129 RepID=A0A8S1L3K3_9CILI|nr:unnamed protein product [Paramecium sonneborni]